MESRRENREAYSPLLAAAVKLYHRLGDLSFVFQPWQLERLMSDPLPTAAQPAPLPPPLPPVTTPPLPPPAAQPAAPPRPAAPGNPLMGCALAFSVLLNFGCGALMVLVCLGAFFTGGLGGLGGDPTGGTLIEKYYSGNQSGKRKVAIIHVDGVILEGILGHVHKQIDQAAKDEQVKAIVLRINSPGGSVTASDELYRRFLELRDGSKQGAKKIDGKPIVVSMGPLAASGGYYIAMPGQLLLAEPSTLTGSIGVYAALPNVTKMGDKYGFAMNTIRAGEIKDSGSPFREMSDKERQVWQDQIDQYYLLFLDIVKKGRPAIKDELLTRFTLDPLNAGPHSDPKAKPYSRYRADGGVWLGQKAVDLKLVDRLGFLDDAIVEARRAGGLDEDSKAIEYERPKTLPELLLGVRTAQPGLVLEPGRLKHALEPRVWYLAPGYELSGLAAAASETR
jgi:protease IV